MKFKNKNAFRIKSDVVEENAVTNALLKLMIVIGIAKLVKNRIKILLSVSSATIKKDFIIKNRINYC
jgi:hypothetical protein